MELGESTLGLLRDEAYVFLCRSAVQEHLEVIEREKANLANTRPPFGLLARKETRESFAKSLRSAEESEASLRDNLARIVRLDDWLRPLIRGNLVTYLREASADFDRFPQMGQWLDEWERALQELPDVLIAFARDMRLLRDALRATTSNRNCAQELAVVREIAGRVEERHTRFARAGAAVVAHAAHLGLTDFRLPNLLELRRVAWVSRLSVMPLEQAALEVTRVEAEVRAFLNGGLQLTEAGLNASREQCEEAQEGFLQSYWDQLRAHALAHYVEEGDVDQILDTLVARYIDSDILRRQAEITHDPFLAER